MQADVTKSASVKDYVAKTLAAYGRIAMRSSITPGIEGKVTPTQDYDEDIFDRVIAVNLKGVFLGHAARPAGDAETGVGGDPVNAASVAGLFGSPGMAAYVASKHGVLGLTKVASTDVAGLGVRVNAVCPGQWRPGWMQSLGVAAQSRNDPEGVHAAYAHAASRPGVTRRQEEIAGAVLYLCSDLSGDVTGTQIVIDGGRSGSGGVAPV